MFKYGLKGCLFIVALIISFRRQPLVKAKVDHAHAFTPTQNSKGVLRTLLVDYGSFTGALLGAIGALAAGGLAWLGVQEQIRYQRQGNNFAELVALQGEIDRSYNKLRLLNIISESHSSVFAARRLPPFEMTDRVDDGKRVLNSHLEDAVNPIAGVRSELEKGSAGILGTEWVTIISRCEQALKLIREKSEDEKITYEWYGKIETPEGNSEITAESFVFGFPIDYLALNLRQCFERDLEPNEKIQISQHEASRQILLIEGRSNKIRNQYDD